MHIIIPLVGENMEKLDKKDAENVSGGSADDMEARTFYPDSLAILSGYASFYGSDYNSGYGSGYGSSFGFGSGYGSSFGFGSGY